MPKIKSFAELKRNIKVGTKLKLIWCWNPKAPFINKTRYCSKVQTNGFWLMDDDSKKETFFAWPDRASEIKFTENGFEIFDKYEKLLSYEFVEE